MDVTRLTEATEYDMPANAAMVDMARMLTAAQARGEMPKVTVAEDGRITLRWMDGTFVSYVTGMPLDMMPRKA